ncbi:polysaccharide deacetylase family protein [Desulfococcaceae bacterium HSG7]|nr:polysaccharide deacetylase family protein [Desulfococcaceae bacterium HSG7]
MKRIFKHVTCPFLFKIQYLTWLIIFILVSLSYAANNFKIVRVRQNDTLSTLAQNYLNDRTKGWMIAEYNGIRSVSAGQEIIIPLKPFNKGGLFASGYQTVPVLSYHRFTRDKKSKNRMVVTQAAFEAQMNYLKDGGYTVVTLSQFYAFLDFEDQIPEKSVVITIDDGFRSAFDIAYPILKKFNYPATFFLYTGVVGSKNAMTWKQIQELKQSGFDIQSQTRTHRDMSKLLKGENFKSYISRLEKEITWAQRNIRDKITITPVFMAYPYGKWNHLVIALLKKHGFRGGLTVERGSNPFFTDNFEVKRAMIYGNYDLNTFKTNLKTFVKEGL